MKLATLTQHSDSDSIKIIPSSNTIPIRRFASNPIKSYNLYIRDINKSAPAHQDCMNLAKSKKRQVIWFTPPFLLRVLNLSKQFFNILKLYFLKHHKYYPIFNKNNMKLSYSTLPNLGSTIISTNKNKIQIHKNLDKRVPNITPNNLIKD